MTSFSSHGTPYANRYGTPGTAGDGNEYPEEVQKETRKEKRARQTLRGISLGSKQIMLTSKVQFLYSHVTSAVVQPSQSNGKVFARGTNQDKSEDKFSADNNKVT